MLLDDPLISRRVFHPRSTDREPNLVVDVGDARLGCHIHCPHPDAGWLLYFHGNGELAAEYVAAGYGDVFGRLGLNVGFVEYRGYGRSTGTPALAAMLGDGEAVLRAVGADPARTVAFGRSLGSLYAVELAARVPGLAGLVIESGIADLTELRSFPDELAGLGVDREELVREAGGAFDQRRKLAGYRGGFLAMHAAGDRLLDRSHADRLIDWAGGADKRKIVFPRGDHNSIFLQNADEYLRELGEFLARVGATG
jgi:pimeloyl-ACP methyl ester carboxylesterase